MVQHRTPSRPGTLENGMEGDQVSRCKPELNLGVLKMGFEGEKKKKFKKISKKKSP